jgi:hypothetical protein
LTARKDLFTEEVQLDQVVGRLAMHVGARRQGP